MRGKPGINDPRDLGMGLEAAPPARGPCALARSERRLRVARPRSASQLSNGLPVWPNVEATDRIRSIALARADHHAQGQVAVAADQLGHRVHDEGRPQLDRPAEQRGERVIDHQGHAGLAGDPGNRFEVGDAEQAGWRSSRRGPAGFAT